MQPDHRPPAPFSHHLDLYPADLVAPAAAERFHHRLFCGEARRVALLLPPPPFAVRLLTRGEDAVSEAFSGLRALQGVTDASHLGEVDPDGNDHGAVDCFSRFGMTISAATAQMPNTNPIAVQRFLG